MNKAEPDDADTIASLLQRYEQTVRDWDKNANKPRKANRLSDRAHNLYKRLRESEQGRAGIAALMKDPNPGVRLTAAADSLRWREAEAIATLEALQNDVSSGLHGVSAKYSLRAHRDGTLNQDW